MDNKADATCVKNQYHTSIAVRQALAVRAWEKFDCISCVTINGPKLLVICNFSEPSASLEGNSDSTIQEGPRLLQNMKINYKSPPIDSMAIQVIMDLTFIC